jgi:RNA polymerase sigma-70 factor (ECF subfamily)
VTTDTRTAVAQAREQFLSMVSDVRPELHRYCARLTGSVVEGEDIVQEALARAFYALSMASEAPPLRPWLFRIAHNAAIDFLKSHGRKLTEVRDDLAEVAGFDDTPDPTTVRAALARFVALPIQQRSAVILKDVLGHSLDETAETMQTTVMAVKALLVRGRAKLREADIEVTPPATTLRTDLERYAALFNAKNWDGVRAMIGEDCRLDLVSRSQRRGKKVGMYFGNYAKLDVSVRPVRLDGELALAAHVDGAEQPAYFILLAFENGHVVNIRDFRYVPYIANEATYELVSASGS